VTSISIRPRGIHPLALVCKAMQRPVDVNADGLGI
jgi:hypothetical protein